MPDPVLSRATALILTDLQRDFLHRDGFLGRNGRRGVDETEIASVLVNCQRLVDAMHGGGGPVIAAFTAFRPDHADCGWGPGWAGRVFGAEAGFLVEGSWGAAPMDGLALGDDDFILTKKGHSAFAGTHLDRLLANLGVETYILAGGPIASSLTDTARNGSMLGFKIYLASDAVFPPLDTYRLTTQADALPTADLVRRIGETVPGPQPVREREEKSALVIVDMQNHFLFPEGPGQNRSPHAGVIENVAALANALRERDCPVIWVKTGRREDRADSAMHRLREDHLIAKGELLYDGTWGAELADGLRPDPADLTVVKRGASAFVFTPLHRILRNLGVSRCIVTGGAATGCVASTARDGAALGYAVSVVSDAVYPADSPYLEIMKDYGEVQTTGSVLAG